MKSVATHLANGRSLVNSVWTVRDPCRSCAVILPTRAHAQTHAHKHRHVLLHTQQTHKQRRAKARTVTHARTHSHILRHNPTYSHALLSKIAGISTRTSTLARSSTHTHTHSHTHTAMAICVSNTFTNYRAAGLGGRIRSPRNIAAV